MLLALLLPFLRKHARVILVVVLSLGTLFGIYGMLHHENTVAQESRVMEIHKLEAEQRRLVKLITQTVNERNQIHEKLTKIEHMQTEMTRDKNREISVEKYDPNTGKLVEKRVSVSHTVGAHKTQAVKTEAQVTDLAHTKQTETKDLTQQDVIITKREDKHEEVVVQHRAPKSGLGVGILATPMGVGPALSYRVVSFGKLGIDAVAALADGPMLGAQVSVEALEAVTVGAGMFVGFDGPATAIQWGKADVVPGVTVQYRF